MKKPWRVLALAQVIPVVRLEQLKPAESVSRP